MLSLIIPCYNEQDNLEELIKHLDQLCNSISDIEIILVNNGSTDRSEEVLNHILKIKNNPKYRVIKVDKNIGYGYGILSGLRSARGNVLSVTHADRQTDPMDVLKALEIYSNQNNEKLLVKGFRKNRKFLEAIFSYGMGCLASWALKVRLSEVNAQPKLFSKSFFDAIEKEAPHDFSLDLYFLYHAKKSGTIVDFPVFFAKRLAGEAKGGSGSSWKVRWKLIKRSFNYIFELRDKIKC